MSLIRNFDFMGHMVPTWLLRLALICAVGAGADLAPFYRGERSSLDGIGAPLEAGSGVKNVRGPEFQLK